jgi:hypothetical protein
MQSTRYSCQILMKVEFSQQFHIVDTVHLRHIKLSYRPTDAH